MPKNTGKIIYEAPKFCNCGGFWCLRHLAFFTNHLKLVNSVPGYILLSFCFRYASFYDKHEHKNILEFILYSIETMISEFCCNENFWFPYKISLVNELSEQLLMSQFMLFNLFKRAFLMFTKLWQCRKKCAVDSTSKLYKHRRFMQFSKLWWNQCSLNVLKCVSSFNPKNIVARRVLYLPHFQILFNPPPCPLQPLTPLLFLLSCFFGWVSNCAAFVVIFYISLL